MGSSLPLFDAIQAKMPQAKAALGLGNFTSGADVIKPYSVLRLNYVSQTNTSFSPENQRSRCYIII